MSNWSQQGLDKHCSVLHCLPKENNCFKWLLGFPSSGILYFQHMDHRAVSWHLIELLIGPQTSLSSLPLSLWRGYFLYSLDFIWNLMAPEALFQDQNVFSFPCNVFLRSITNSLSFIETNKVIITFRKESKLIMETEKKWVKERSELHILPWRDDFFFVISIIF